MSDWTAPAFIDLLQTRLLARATLTAMDPPVAVFTYDPNPDDTVTDRLVIGYRVADENEPAALGQGRYEETVTVNCEIMVVRAGAGDVKAAAARTRAADILGELDNELRTDPLPQVGDQTTHAQIAKREMMQFPSTYGTAGAGVRVCVIRLDVVYTARTSPAST